jgi:hypothetical protein
VVSQKKPGSPGFFFGDSSPPQADQAAISAIRPPAVETPAACAQTAFIIQQRNNGSRT